MEKLVVKYGRTSIQKDSGVGLDQNKVNQYVDKLLGLHGPRGLAIVASGSVVMGKEVALERGLKGLTETGYAMLGTADAHKVWDFALERHGLATAQLLVTHRELADRSEGAHLRHAIESCFNEGIVPVVNQNDPVSDEEMEKYHYGGENDGLGVEVAILINAERYMMFTDAEGVLKAPGVVVPKLTLSESDYALSLVDESMSGGGKGGMRTKIKAGYRGAECGVTSTISSPDSNYNAVMAGQEGTTILPEAA